MSSRRQKVATGTPDIAAGQVALLHAQFPHCFTEGKVDFDKLRAALGDNVDSRPERYSFSWAGKSDAIRVLQMPTRSTLVPCPDESVNFDTTGNLFIEGDNLEVLKLLGKSYFGNVKMIYIDPPYNTGNDFVYKDNYADPLDTYLKLTGQKDSDGNLLTSNPETGGRYHSAWLSMMYPRLFLARQLLREDGVIFISIDDHEVHNLRLILDEVFGGDNFEGHIHWRRRHNQPNDKTKMIALVAEHILAYSKNKDLYKQSGVGKVDLTGSFANPDNDPRGDWASKPWKVGSGQSGTRYKITSPTGRVLEEEWMGDRQTFDALVKDNRIVWPKKGDGLPRKKYFRHERAQEGQCATNWWPHDEFGNNQEANHEMTSLFGAKNLFDNPKPTKLIRGLIQISNVRKDEIILDFFAGSCTTAHAVLGLNKEDGDNRRFICVQLPEPMGNKEFPTIAEIGKERIRRVIRKLGRQKDQGMQNELLSAASATSADSLGFKVFKLAQSNLRPWTGVETNDPEAYAKQMELHIDPLVDKWQAIDVIWEVAIKEGYGLNATITEVKGVKGAKVYLVTDEEKGQSFRICLDATLSAGVVKALELKKDDLFICRDIALDDELAANMALQCRLKTI